MVSDPSFKNLKFSERYDIRYELGKGGMGVVFKARDKLLAKDVAIKLLKHKGNQDSVIRFQTEARACGRLKHKNILSALDFGTTEDGDPYLVLDFVEGRGIDEILRDRTRLPLKYALPIILEIVAGMSYAHSVDILHRDLKPSNVMLTRDENDRETVKIMDFGLAKFSRDEDQSLTGKGIIGSPKYLSPEQAAGEEVDERTDIYSFGCTMFEILTGEVPILGDTAFDTILLKQSKNAPPLNETFPDGNFPAKLESIVARCLYRDKNDRYKNFARLRDDLIEFIDSGEVETDDAIAEARQLAKAETRGKPGRYAMLYATIAIAATGVAVSPFVHRLQSKPEPAMNVKKQRTPLPSADEPFKTRSGKSLTLGNINRGWLTKNFARTDAQYVVHTIMTSDATGETLQPLTQYAIRHLKLSDSKVDDATMAEIAKIRSLESIWILNRDGEIDVTRKGLEALKQLPRLAKLHIEKQQLTDSELQAIGQLKHLRHLIIQSSGYTPKGIAQLRNIPGLHTLDLGDATPDECVSEAAKLENLTTFGLHCPRNGQLASCLRQLRSLPRLTGLQLTNTEIKSKDFTGIDRLTKLAFLTLNNSTIEGFDPIKDLRRSKQLKTIYLVGMQRLSNEQIVYIGTKPGLKQLVWLEKYEKDPSVEPRIRRISPTVQLSNSYED
jgi:serine/threonine-protein kinase